MARGNRRPLRDDRRGQLPNALRIGLLGPLQVQDEAGRVVPTGSLAERIWPVDPARNPGSIDIASAVHLFQARDARPVQAPEPGIGHLPRT
jgi:hypothetical protein